MSPRRIYPLTGEIRGPGGTSHIQPKVMEVLLCLAQQQGDILERARIVEQVWGDTAVSDEVLTRCISDLRDHLGDDNSGRCSESNLGGSGLVIRQCNAGKRKADK